jgi:transcriptional regulator with XRE-family HTH domain
MIARMGDWREDLRAYRERVRLSRDQLARISGVSEDTIKAYESGRRHPTQTRLTKILDALKVEREERAALLHGAGFAMDGRPVAVPASEMYSAEDAAAAVDRYRWPAFVVDLYLSVVAANPAAQRLWGVDLSREFLDPLDRNLLSIATNPRFADRCVNWDEAVGLVIAAWKTSDFGTESLDNPTPFLAQLLERFMSGDPKYVMRLGDLWAKAPDVWTQKMRWSYPVVWNEPGIGVLRFECLASTASELAGLSFNDWIPIDCGTWQRLDELEARGR